MHFSIKSSSLEFEDEMYIDLRSKWLLILTLDKEAITPVIPPGSQMNQKPAKAHFAKRKQI